MTSLYYPAALLRLQRRRFLSNRPDFFLREEDREVIVFGPDRKQVTGNADCRDCPTDRDC